MNKACNVFETTICIIFGSHHPHYVNEEGMPDHKHVLFRFFGKS